MSNKKYRFQIIKDLIKNDQINSQEELLRKLVDLDIVVTQATLSRDLRELKISKVPNHDGNYIYKLADADHISTTTLHSDKVIIEFSNNLAVIKTKPGYATGLAYEIDTKQFKNIIGTIAGDDTILIILRENSKKEEVITELKVIIPNINK